jgi:ribonuclease P protein component
VVHDKRRIHRLTKREILRRPEEFSIIFQSGRFLRGRFFDVAFLFGENRQAGFATSKRIHTAVARNRIKRRLREAYRLEKMNFDNRVKLVFIGHESVARAHWDDLCKQMRKMAARISAGS